MPQYHTRHVHTHKRALPCVSLAQPPSRRSWPRPAAPLDQVGAPGPGCQCCPRSRPTRNCDPRHVMLLVRARGSRWWWLRRGG
eukprot:674767-Rhodomonas_salina.2